jgi:mono/diheme cytochrome c family protein
MKKIFFYSFIILLLIQLYRPKKNKSTQASENHISTVVDVPENVQEIFKRSCNDCHSNNTNYLWYHEIAPFSWGVAHHIKEGKEHLNFDEFANYNERQQNHVIEEIVETVEHGEMPLKGYVVFHPETALSDTDMAAIKAWGDQFEH